ncbi:hypothetical protein HN51_041482 [Arachis hypogaea]|uniref:Nucleotide-diphospho-sugar transferase domain-containing protein n=1 Tax=Arachis hypogaea TaxID=3818 RepID=A0A444YSU4_ARAHY|nr:uncharacterized protein At4g15970 [Arachis ipaensis]XP_025658795.1 uncharacterized protein At4g15970 [Arachis hypogaea]QHN87244.1 uncharacterized protein DS421_16g553380 [Arachis hypogaea]RYR04978.1 hypothetical protein Ahy_B06g084791 [Arachis hypogaea]
MRALALRKPLHLPLIAFLIVLLCFLLYHYNGSLEQADIKSVLKSPSTLQRQELVQVLKKVAMPDRTIILTMVDESWARPGSILDVFLQSFKHGDGTQRFLNHLAVIAMDPKAYEYCISLHHHCIHPNTFVHYFATKIQSTTGPDHSSFSWRRNNVLLEMLELGYNTIFTEADVLWLRSPLSHFNPIQELSISCDSSGNVQSGDYSHDGGIFFLKANGIAFEFLKYWKLVKFLFPKSPDEDSLCATIAQNQDMVAAYGFRVNHIDTTYFGGFCQQNKDMLMEASTIHANCCEDLTNKVHDLRSVLDDWIQFRKNVSGSGKMIMGRPWKCLGRKFT